MTSNLGAEFISSQPGSKIQEATKGLVMGVVRQHFRPEFLNRISGIVVFNKLSRKAIHKIVDIRLKEIEQRFEENDKHYKLDVSVEAKDFLAKYGYSSDMGARPLNRLIQNEILNKMAIRILKNEIKDKETVRVILRTGKARGTGYNEEEEEGLEVLANHESSGNPMSSSFANTDSMDIDEDLYNDEDVDTPDLD